MNMDEAARDCRTYRRFSQNKIPADLLRRAIENARISNSARNAQVLRYVAVCDPDVVADMQPLVKWAASLPRELGTPKPGEQPTAFVAICKTQDAGPFSDIDVGIAARTITLTAWEVGVGSCMMGAIDKGGIEKLLGIPDDLDLRLVIAFGYPSHASAVVPIPDDGNQEYRLDDNHDYLVPKLPLEQVARFI